MNINASLRCGGRAVGQDIPPYVITILFMQSSASLRYGKRGGSRTHVARLLCRGLADITTSHSPKGMDGYPFDEHSQWENYYEKPIRP